MELLFLLKWSILIPPMSSILLLKGFGYSTVNNHREILKGGKSRWAAQGHWGLRNDMVVSSLGFLIPSHISRTRSYRILQPGTAIRHRQKNDPRNTCSFQQKDQKTYGLITEKFLECSQYSSQTPTENSHTTPLWFQQGWVGSS